MIEFAIYLYEAFSNLASEELNRLIKVAEQMALF